MKYMFEVPDGWDLSKRFVRVDSDDNIVIDNGATIKLSPMPTGDIDIQEVLSAINRLVDHSLHTTVTFLTPHGSYSAPIRDLLIYEDKSGIVFDAE